MSEPQIPDAETFTILSPVVTSILCNVTVADDVARGVDTDPICLSHAFKRLKREHIGDARTAFGSGLSKVIFGA